MTVIDDEILAMIVSAMMAITVYAAYLRLITVRRLRKRVDRLVDARIAGTAEAPQVAPAPASQADSAEFARVQQRVAVLERIITDGGLQTAAQIDALRSPGERLVHEPVR